MSSQHGPHQELEQLRKFTLQDSKVVYELAEKSTALGRQVKDALSIIDKALEEYGPEHLALSFNGGKDCTVLVHLLAASFFRFSNSKVSTTTSNPSSSSTKQTSQPPIRSIYVRCASPFPQVETFVTICQTRYNLELEAVEGGMKEALGVYIDRRTKLGDTNAIKAVLVGTRRSDPHGAPLKPFTLTDPDWPQFMRVHPILDWTYSQIWEFLREPSLTLGDGIVEWCELYDYGYTSLGSTHNTFPNPLLKATNHTSIVGGWKPAWELIDESQERAGREIRISDLLEQAKKEDPAT